MAKPVTGFFSLTSIRVVDAEAIGIICTFDRLQDAITAETGMSMTDRTNSLRTQFESIERLGDQVVISKAVDLAEGC